MDESAMLQKCPRCAMPKLTPDGLARHLTTIHKVNPPWADRIAQQIFASKSEAVGSGSVDKYGSDPQYNQGNMHQQDTGPSYPCPVCKVPKNSIDNMSQHLTHMHRLQESVAHSMAEGIFTGQYTEPLQRTSSSMMQQHSQKTHKCFGCHQTFTDTVLFEQHAQSCNTGSQPCQCSSCGTFCNSKAHHSQHIIETNCQGHPVPISPQRSMQPSTSTARSDSYGVPNYDQQQSGLPMYSQASSSIYNSPPQYPYSTQPSSYPGQTTQAPAAAAMFPAYASAGQQPAAAESSANRYDQKVEDRRYQSRESLSPARRRSRSPVNRHGSEQMAAGNIAATYGRDYDQRSRSPERRHSPSPYQRQPESSQTRYGVDIPGMDAPYKGPSDPYFSSRGQRSLSPVPQRPSREMSPSYGHKSDKTPYSKDVTKREHYASSYGTRHTPSPPRGYSRDKSPSAHEHKGTKRDSHHLGDSPDRLPYRGSARRDRYQESRSPSREKGYSLEKHESGYRKASLRGRSPSPPPKSKNPSPPPKSKKVKSADSSAVSETLNKLQSLHMGDEIIMDGERYLVIRDVPNCLMPFS